MNVIKQQTTLKKANLFLYFLFQSLISSCPVSYLNDCTLSPTESNYTFKSLISWKAAVRNRWSVVNHQAESLLMDIYWDYRSVRVGSDHSVVPLTWSCWHLSCTSASQRSLSWASASGNELQKNNEVELRVALCLFPANHPDEYYHTSFSFSF